MLRISSGTLLKASRGPFFSKIFAEYGSCTSTRVAVVLSGCGVYDGSEIHEAVAVLSHLTRNQAVPVAFAPNIKQMHVINHQKGEVDASQTRMVLAESARITRGPVQSICELINNIGCFDAVIFPGGFGVAKNLSDYAIKGADCTVIPEVVKVIEEFHKARKPQAFLCIAPILAARVICPIKITLGKNSCDKWPHRAAIEDAKKMGATVELRDWNETSFDEKNIIFSSPAYMYDGQYHEIDDAIGSMVKYMLAMLRKGDLKPSEKCPPPDCKHS